MVKEGIITVNMQKILLKRPNWRRGKNSTTKLKEILRKRTKVENVKIDKKLNERIWSRGIRKPSTKLRIKIVKIDDNSIRAELVE